MILQINEDIDTELDVNSMSKDELRTNIINMLNKIKPKAIKLDLDKDIFDTEGKETYYEIHDKIYTVLNNKNNHGFYTNKWYVFIIEKQLVFFYYTNRKTLKFFFTNTGFTWSITKNGKTNLDRAWDKLDAMKQLYSIADEYLSN